MAENPTYKGQNYAEKLKEYGIDPACGWGDGLEAEPAHKQETKPYKTTVSNIPSGWGDST